jgi:hypothetical protein
MDYIFLMNEKEPLYKLIGGTDNPVRGALAERAYLNKWNLRPSGATRTGLSAPPNIFGQKKGARQPAPPIRRE